MAATLDELSRLVLAPVAAELDGRRLVVVADGALHYVPFSVLPRPGAAGEILLDRHEVVHLPSISALALLRRGRGGHRSPERTLAVLADPVFGAGDERLAGGARTEASTPVAALEPAGGPERGDRFVRLPATRDEALAIAALLPPGEVWSALGFAARREAVLSGELAPFRFLHFAGNPRDFAQAGLVYFLRGQRQGCARLDQVAVKPVTAFHIDEAVAITGMRQIFRLEEIPQAGQHRIDLRDNCLAIFLRQPVLLDGGNAFRKLFDRSEIG